MTTTDTCEWSVHYDALLCNVVISTDPLLSGCPDFESLAPSPAVVHKKKKLQFKLQDEEEGDEIRMCPDCKQIVDRYVCVRMSPLKKMPLCVLIGSYCI